MITVSRTGVSRFWLLGGIFVAGSKKRQISNMRSTAESVTISMH